MGHPVLVKLRILFFAFVIYINLLNHNLLLIGFLFLGGQWESQIQPISKSMRILCSAILLTLFDMGRGGHDASPKCF